MSFLSHTQAEEHPVGPPEDESPDVERSAARLSEIRAMVLADRYYVPPAILAERILSHAFRRTGTSRD